MIDEGYDIVAPIPSCVLMFKQELPLMFPERARSRKDQAAYIRSIRILGAAAQIRTDAHDFARPLGKVAYHVACHLRVQNIGLKTRDILQLIPGTLSSPSKGVRVTTARTVKREFAIPP